MRWLSCLQDNIACRSMRYLQVDASRFAWYGFGLCFVFSTEAPCSTVVTVNVVPVWVAPSNRRF